MSMVSAEGDRPDARGPPSRASPIVRQRFEPAPHERPALARRAARSGSTAVGPEPRPARAACQGWPRRAAEGLVAANDRELALVAASVELGWRAAPTPCRAKSEPSSWTGPVALNHSGHPAEYWNRPPQSQHPRQPPPARLGPAVVWNGPLPPCLRGHTPRRPSPARRHGRWVATKGAPLATPSSAGRASPRRRPWRFGPSGGAPCENRNPHTSPGLQKAGWTLWASGAPLRLPAPWPAPSPRAAVATSRQSRPRARADAVRLPTDGLDGPTKLAGRRAAAVEGGRTWGTPPNRATFSPRTDGKASSPVRSPMSGRCRPQAAQSWPIARRGA